MDVRSLGPRSNHATSDAPLGFGPYVVPAFKPWSAPALRGRTDAYRVTRKRLPRIRAEGDPMESARIPVNKQIGDTSTELSARRTGMSFHRTRLSADRTLMSVIRTSLSLISFGFTIYQLFSKLFDQGLIGRPQAGRNFGAALVL